MVAQYAKLMGTVLKSVAGQAVAEQLKQKGPEYVEQVRQWAVRQREQRSLAARVDGLKVQAEAVVEGATTVEEGEAAQRFVSRARALGPVLALADQKTGRDKSAARRRVRAACRELEDEITAFLLARGAVAGT